VLLVQRKSVESGVKVDNAAAAESPAAATLLVLLSKEAASWAVICDAVGGVGCSAGTWRSMSCICWRRKRMRCSCRVAWISASRTRDRAIFSSADTFVIP